MPSSLVTVFDHGQDQGSLKQVIERFARSLRRFTDGFEQLRMCNVSILRKESGLSLPGYWKEEYLYIEQDGYC